MALLLFRLFDLTFNQGEDLLSKAQEFSRKELRLTGARGKILDRNGLPLAYNETSYDVQFIKDPKLNKAPDRKSYTDSIIRTIDIIEENGGKLSTRFAMTRGSDGKLTLTWIGLNPEEDQASYDKQVKIFRENMSASTSSQIKKNMELEEMLAKLREYYFIPETFSEEKAMKVLSVWQQVKYSTYTISYIPVVLALDVDMNTVTQVEVRSNELLGVQIGQGRTRVYPNKSMAAHIIGYTGRMLNEKTIVQNENAGYKRDDLVGISGIEKSEELELTGNTAERTGTRVVEVDSKGKVIRELESDNKQPTAGNNVMLTIDSGLQKVAEEALAKNVQMIHDEQVEKFNDPVISLKQQYQEKIDARSKTIGKPWPISYCNSGAVVVMDVHTGDILAMASYPTYDLNLFTGGISVDQLTKLQEDTANPLFNRAIASRGTPGSIFKMATGLAGLMEGVINVGSTISCQDKFTKYAGSDPGSAPECYISNPAKHANLNIVNALEVSCNYFFFTVADDLKIDRLNKWADLLGLSSLTGVELPGEVKSQIGNQKTLYDPDSSPGGVASLVYKNIKEIIQEGCDAQHITVADKKMDTVVRELMKLAEMESSMMGPDIRAILKNEVALDAQTIASKDLSNRISQQIVQIRWNPTYTITTGIGQGVTMITPIAAARYMSALVNGGEVYDAKIIKAIVSPEGKVREKTPLLVRNLGITPESQYLQLIKEGMKYVVSEEDGTAANEFKDFEYKGEMGGKTGTAQVSKIDLENNAWFVCFAPFEQPEIAVVVYMPNGDVGHLASPTAQAVVKYYLDKKKQEQEPAALPLVNAQTH